MCSFEIADSGPAPPPPYSVLPAPPPGQYPGYPQYPGQYPHQGQYPQYPGQYPAGQYPQYPGQYPGKTEPGKGEVTRATGAGGGVHQWQGRRKSSGDSSAIFPTGNRLEIL